MWTREKMLPQGEDGCMDEIKEGMGPWKRHSPRRRLG